MKIPGRGIADERPAAIEAIEELKKLQAECGRELIEHTLHSDFS